jgi:hypothetical protein
MIDRTTYLLIIIRKKTKRDIRIKIAGIQVVASHPSNPVIRHRLKKEHSGTVGIVVCSHGV